MWTPVISVPSVFLTTNGESTTTSSLAAVLAVDAVCAKSAPDRNADNMPANKYRSFGFIGVRVFKGAILMMPMTALCHPMYALEPVRRDSPNCYRLGFPFRATH